jgi:hypothetical protein
MSKNLKADLLESDAPTSQPQPPLAYAIEDIPARTGIPRTKVFEAIRKKKLTARKAGRSTIIDHPELVRYIETLPTKGREPEVPLANNLTTRTTAVARPRRGRPPIAREADTKA